MTTEPAHTRNQLQDDIDKVRDNYRFSCVSGTNMHRVVDAAQRYCDTLPKVHHQKTWAVIGRDGVYHGAFEDRELAVDYASRTDTVVCEMTGSCEL